MGHLAPGPFVWMKASPFVRIAPEHRVIPPLGGHTMMVPIIGHDMFGVICVNRHPANVGILRRIVRMNVWRILQLHIPAWSGVQTCALLLTHGDEDWGYYRYHEILYHNYMFLFHNCTSRNDNGGGSPFLHTPVTKIIDNLTKFLGDLVDIETISLRQQFLVQCYTYSLTGP